MYVKIILSLMATFLSINNALARPVVSEVKEFKNHGEIDKIQCDKTKSFTVKLGDKFNFDLEFSTKDNRKALITDINYWFWADKDYNGDDALITLKSTKEIEDANWTATSKKIKVAESTDYKIRNSPDKSSDENIIFKSQIVYKEILSDGSLSTNPENIVHCFKIRVK